MIAEKMRKSILQAAIQGKLTEQLPEDGDARELLAAIKAEKDQLVKEGKIKKEKPLPEITEEEIPFEIPENWKWSRLGDLVINRDAERKPVSKIEREGLKKEYDYYGASGVIDKIDRYLFSEELLLIGEDGANLLNRSTPIAFIARGKYWVNNHAHVLQMTNGVDIEYLCNYVNAINLAQYVTGTAQPKMNQQKMNLINVSVPPLKEQERIVERIKTVFLEIDKLQKYEKELELLQKSFPKKMKDSLLQAAIQGKLTEQMESDGDARDLVAEIQKEKECLIIEGKIKREKALPEITEDEIPFDIPENWCWVRLGDVTDYGIGKQVNQNNIAPNSWILELEDIEKETFKLNCKRFDRKPGSSKNKFTNGDILYGKLRPYLKKVIIADESGYCSTEIIPFHGYRNINSSYLKYCMVAPSVDRRINQITHGMDMPRLGTDKAKRLIIPLPPLAEQRRIVERIDQLLPLCDALEKKT
jgi:type I restriction enzyme S subunit